MVQASSCDSPNISFRKQEKPSALEPSDQNLNRTFSPDVTLKVQNKRFNVSFYLFSSVHEHGNCPRGEGGGGILRKPFDLM